MKENSIKNYYDALLWGEKSIFMAWICSTCEMSINSVKTRLRDNAWRQIEREAIEKGMKDYSWKEVQR